VEWTAITQRKPGGRVEERVHALVIVEGRVIEHLGNSAIRSKMKRASPLDLRAD
jgi:hypothetical protein